ncbi:uncharacterized protein B0I36DRAFT_370348 [Microdochium trichocladiopsis]|uniref:Uncharacterized protein n=1 Tax=Microdochium trichocladiopsis TaxID=1682393 RepID=A0A9P8XPP2_9PEZI|nr:uncharacterized protein B0I36DRAFT_370348 [Microdochium trichocladiopsis]KAH7009411.1 hypothetical protein B0I36DRAFT_370348 [Microdochium trichocladiopsis]
MVTIQSLGSAFFRQQLAVAIYKLADVLENLTYVTGLPQESIGLIIGSIAFFLITYFSLAPLAFGRVSREKRWEELTPETQDDWKMRTSNLVKGTAFGFDAAYIVITDILAGRAYLFERICHRRAHGERLTAIAMGFYLWHSVSLVRKIYTTPFSSTIIFLELRDYQYPI